MSTPQRMLCVDDEENVLRSLMRLVMTVRIVLSRYADSAAVVSAIKEGRIYKFIFKPWNDEFRLTIADAFDRYELKEQNVLLSQELSKRNDELLSLNTILEERITDKDRIITNGSGTGTVTINSHSIVMRGEGIRHPNNEESFVFTLHEKEDAAVGQ